MELRKSFWKAVWVCSICTLEITVIFKDGVVIKLDSIWGGVEQDVGPDDLKDRTNLGCSPSTIVEYWDVR